VPVPHEIILPAEPDGMAGIAEWLGERAGHKVQLVHPRRGERVDLLALATDNARHSFVEKRRHSDDIQDRLADLQERLRLPTVPRRIECCDISHLGGGDTAGAVVAMLDGELDKKRYRSFHVRGAGTEGVAMGDDYAAMYEVLARRFRRGLALRKAETAALAEATEERAEAPTDSAEDSSWDLPDVFVVDGGRGQLAVALAAARDLGLHDLPIVALAKEKENVAGETLVDRVYLPGQKNPIPLRSSTTSLFLLARLRDEAHRFSNRAREKMGKKRRIRSALDDVKGIGEGTKKSLLRHLGSVAAIKKARDEELLAVPGVTARHVKALREGLG
jgi:excinuclease ABC subunit C